MLNMTRISTIALLTIGAGAPVALAQNEQRPSQTQPERQQMLHFMLSEDVLGAGLVGRSGETAGDIQDIIIDARSSKMKYVIISVGGVLGLGDKLVAVPIDDVRWNSGSEQFVLGTSAANLEAMPSFEAKKWSQLEHKDWEQALSENNDQNRDNNRDANRDSDRDQQDRDQQDRNAKDQKDQMAKTLIRVSDISGSKVKATTGQSNARDVTLEKERIGQIDGAVFEFTTNSTPFVVISTGGVLGFGADDRVVPWDALAMRGEDLVLTGVTPDAFKSLESVKKSEIKKLKKAEDVKPWYEAFDVEADDFKNDNERNRSGG